MRPYQIFARMAPEEALRVLRTVAEQAPAAFARTLAAASSVLRARPIYLQRMPFERRAEAVRRTLARVAADELAEDVLAIYFLECRREILVEWLDALGVEHEEGMLKDDAPPCPAEKKLREALSAFRRSEAADRADRELLLRSFVAQRSVQWPALETLLDEIP